VVEEPFATPDSWQISSTVTFSNPRSVISRNAASYIFCLVFPPVWSGWLLFSFSRELSSSTPFSVVNDGQTANQRYKQHVDISIHYFIARQTERLRN
jgi:hypothetical protein